MLGKYIRLIGATLICTLSIFLFIKGFVGWGVLAMLIALLFVLFHFKNEMNLIAFLFIRRGKFETAEKVFATVKHPERMIKSQEAYFYYLLGLTQSNNNKLTESHKNLKRALSTGLRLESDQAMAKLSLAGYYLSRRNKKIARVYLMDSKKLDKKKMLKPQIKELEDAMKRM